MVSSSTNPLAYPILEFTNLDSNPRIRAWQTFNPGSGWVEINSVPAAYGSSVELEIVANPFTQKFEFLVDGTLIH